MGKPTFWVNINIKRPKDHTIFTVNLAKGKQTEVRLVKVVTFCFSLGNIP